MPTLKEAIVKAKKNAKKDKADKGKKAKPKSSGKSKAAAKPAANDDSDSHQSNPLMVVSPSRKAKTKAINQMNRAAGRRLAVSDDSEDDIDSDEATPVYESNTGTKTTGLDDMLVGKLIETPVKARKSRLVQSPSDKTNQYAVHSVVGTELFPRVKFLDSINDLIYSKERNTICNFVMSRCKLSLDVNEELFWEKAKDWVKKCLARHRSDKATAFRNVFHCKSIHVISHLFAGIVCSQMYLHRVAL